MDRIKKVMLALAIANLQSLLAMELALTAQDFLAAVKAGEVGRAKMALDQGIDVNTKDEAGVSALEWTIYANRDAAFGLLMSNPRIDLYCILSRLKPSLLDRCNVAFPYNWQDLAVAARSRGLVMTAILAPFELVLRGSQDEDFYYDCDNYQSSLTYKLLQKKISENERFILAAHMGNGDKVRTAIDTGININAYNRAHWTALMAASHGGRKKIVEMLLQLGADVRAKNLAGHTAIYYAARRANIKECFKSLPIVGLLAKAGADCEEIKEWAAEYKFARDILRPRGFATIAGEIPLAIKEIVDFIKYPERLQRLQIAIPRGILMEGPPGTGKTAYARAISEECGVPFFPISGSNVLDKWLGESERKVRELFSSARQAAQGNQYSKAIIFIDEIDSIGGSRNAGPARESHRSLVTTLLSEMDGFVQDNSVIVLAATNDVRHLDEALRRPGRFDRILRIDLPSEQNRKSILQHYAREVARGVDYDILARGTEGFSPADLKNLVNEAKILAWRENAEFVAQGHFDAALRDIVQTRRRVNN